VQPSDTCLSREADLLKSTHPTIPTGDCIIASKALAKKAKILSDDRHYDEIKDVSRT
jgi:predicted nucleic acid-binding protein